MSHDKAIHSINHITESLVTINRTAREQTTACSVSYCQHIGRILNSVGVFLSDLHFHEGHILSVEMLDIELAHNVIGGVIVRVLTASAFVIPGHGAKYTVP